MSTSAIPTKLVISRTDSIGDVMLTLPMASWLKRHFPDVHITFLCKAYTAPLVRMHQAVDEVLVLDELQKVSEKEQVLLLQSLQLDTVVHVFPNKALARLFKKAGVKDRIGTSHRLFHWLTCNMRPSFTRKGSPLHEAQLNFELLKPLGCKEIPSLEELTGFLGDFVPSEVALPEKFKDLLHEEFVILHTKSQGSAREWPLERYKEVAQTLIDRNIRVVYTGTEKEGQLFRSELLHHPLVIDSSGQLSIEQLVVLIGSAKALVACSTGPLHIAGYLGIKAIGLYSPRIPIHPGRWKPLGRQAVALVYDENCARCQSKEACQCIEQIPSDRVIAEILNV